MDRARKEQSPGHYRGSLTFVPTRLGGERGRPIQHASVSVNVCVWIMDRAGTVETQYTEAPEGTVSLSEAQRAFSLSMVVSGIRCVLAYVILPFVTPFLGLAPGVGPVLGLGIGAVAITANVFSLRRFWRVKHPWRRWITVLHVAVITFLLVLMGVDTAELMSQIG